MKFLEVVRYELDHRVRSGSTWAYAAFMVAVGILWMMDAGTVGAIHANAPIENGFGASLGPQVTMDVVARKLRPDSAGKQTEVPMNDLIDIGVFAPSKGGSLGEPLYLQQHRIRSGAQRISVTVPKQPALAGIDPYHKLLERAARDNVVTPRPGAR